MLKKVYFNQNNKKGYIFSFDKENFVLIKQDYSYTQIKFGDIIKKSIVSCRREGVLIEIENLESYLREKYIGENYNIFIYEGDLSSLNKKEFIEEIKNI